MKNFNQQVINIIIDEFITNNGLVVKDFHIEKRDEVYVLRSSSKITIPYIPLFKLGISILTHLSCLKFDISKFVLDLIILERGECEIQMKISVKTIEQYIAEYPNKYSIGKNCLGLIAISKDGVSALTEIGQQ